MAVIIDGGSDGGSGVSDVSALTTSGLTGLNYLRVKTGSDGLEERTPAQVLSDIGAAASSSLGSYLPKTAGIGQGVTGTLYLDPGGDDAAQIFRIPVTDAQGADVVFNINSIDFSGVTDTTINLGFNNAAAGALNAAKHAWYSQWEYYYQTGGDQWVEYHINLLGASGAFSFRPVEYKYNVGGTAGTITWRATSVTFSGLDGTGQIFTLGSLGTSDAVVTLRNLVKIVPVNSTTVVGFYIEGPSYNLDALVAGNRTRTFRGNTFDFKNDGDVSIFTLDNTAAGGKGINRSKTSLYVTGAVTTAPTLYIVGPASHTANLIQAVNNATAIQFAIGPAGQIRTNQTAANTATPSGATAYQLPLYNAAGTLLGYVPIYGSAWT